MKKIVLATSNPRKIYEFTDLLSNTEIEIISQKKLGVNSIQETGLTFVENAILKARNATKKTGLPAISDDSGLSVDILGGAPGIYSARYAAKNATDQQNIDKLLHLLKNVPQNYRKAKFHCILVYMRNENDPLPLICYGDWMGEITVKSIKKSGLGYDPIFYLPKLNCTAGDLNQKEKNIISHRGKAMKLMLSFIKSI
ncbi:dITP/XTP pyrophosphatase [Serratia symbiotica]|nr:dITP/XTP pyrophosphatase [Serratia symbiotica]